MNKGYWGKRSRMIYYRYLDLIVRGVAGNCHSLIDVGSHNTSFIEAFHWIEELVALDIRAPHTSERVRGIEMDFFKYQPEKRYDLALCCEVLEHIPDAGAFAKHLFDVADRVLISVPYRWPQGSSKHHIHDPVDLKKLVGWTEREPAYHIVVEEPLCTTGKCRRLIAYFPAKDDNFSMKAARDAIRMSPG
jgi:hypothetical protein